MGSSALFLHRQGTFGSCCEAAAGSSLGVDVRLAAATIRSCVGASASGMDFPGRRCSMRGIASMEWIGPLQRSGDDRWSSRCCRRHARLTRTGSGLQCGNRLRRGFLGNCAMALPRVASFPPELHTHNKTIVAPEQYGTFQRARTSTGNTPVWRWSTGWNASC